MSERPPGLVYRRCEPVDERNKRVTEVWDITTPGCPVIKNPWISTHGIVTVGFTRFVPAGLPVEEFEELSE